MSLMECEKCSQTLALADQICPACAHAVPVEQRWAMIQPKADALANQERYAEAARALSPALALALPPEQLKGLWRKKGAWLRRAARERPELLDEAESALAEALRLDDSDDLSHQVWIDLLVERGMADKAREWYRQRMELNPEDGMAKRQMAVLRLAADFKAQPQVVRAAAVEEPNFRLWRLIAPGKIATAFWALSTMATLVMLIYVLFVGEPSMPSADSGLVDPELASALQGSAVDVGGIFKALSDPWSLALQAVFSGAYAYWGWTRIRRG